MIYYELINNEGAVLYSTIKGVPEFNYFEERKTENLEVKGIKQVFRKYEHGTVRLISVLESDLLSSNKIANRTAQAYSNLIEILEGFNKDQTVQYAILSHNLVTTHSRLQDQIESIVSANELENVSVYPEQVLVIKNKIEKNVDQTSQSVFQIAKRIVDLQAQIEGFKILSGKIQLDVSFHNIKRALLNIIYPYYDEFGKNNVTVKLNIDDEIAEKNPISLDYKVFNLAMHHFLNNAVKYVRPYSLIDVRFIPESKTLSFKMISVRIEKDEYESIYKLRISGKNAGALAGDGIGMYMIDKALNLLGAKKMRIQSDYSKEEEIESIKYTQNTFSITFN